MDRDAVLLRQFETERPRLRSVAYRMLGSLSEAEDAVQEVWLRLDRAQMAEVENLAAWLTTVVSRICLDLLRSRQTRREDSLESFTTDWLGAADEGTIPEAETLLADEVGLAMLVVLDTLSPAERVAFVLHDMFNVAFDDMSPMMDRTSASLRQLASRARRKVKGVPASTGDPSRRQAAVDAYMAASRAGDFEALLSLLDPDVVLHADAAARRGKAVTLQGALAVAKSALAAATRKRHAVVALVDGFPALIVAPAGHLALVLRYTYTDDYRVSGIDIIADPQQLRAMTVAIVDASGDPTMQDG